MLIQVLHASDPSIKILAGKFRPIPKRLCLHFSLQLLDVNSGPGLQCYLQAILNKLSWRSDDLKSSIKDVQILLGKIKQIVTSAFAC